MLTIRNLAELHNNGTAVTKLLRIHDQMNPRALTTRMAALTPEETEKLRHHLVMLDRVIRQIGDSKAVFSVAD